MPSSRNDLANDILNNVSTVLDKSKGFLDLAPVPGLSAAAEVVLAIIMQVKVRVPLRNVQSILTANAGVGSMQKMRGNKETVAALSSSWWYRVTVRISSDASQRRCFRGRVRVST